MTMKTDDVMFYYANTTIKFHDMFTHRVPSATNDTVHHSSTGRCSFVFPLAGQGYFTFENVRYKLMKGMVLHMHSTADIYMKPIGREGCHYAVMYYDVDEAIISDEPFVMAIDDYHTCQRTVERMAQAFTTPGNLSRVQTKAYFMQFISEMLMAHQRSKRIDREDAMSEALTFMRNYYQSGLTVTEVAERFDIERRRFAHLFERYTGINPSNYLIELRIQHAKELMRATDETIASIAEKVGYDDPFYFSRIFKKYTGKAPTVYRQCL